MMGSRVAWQHMLKLWLPALVLLVINLGILSTYRFLLAGQAQLRSARVQKLSVELQELETRRSALEELMGQAEANRLRIGEFRSGWLSTEAQRLTGVITEVKTLAGRAGVQTSSFQYPAEFLEDYRLNRRSIVFSANGSYQALRRLINFIELSDQFMILEEVRLSETGQQGVDVRVDFRVSTLFTSDVDPGADV